MMFKCVVVNKRSVFLIIDEINEEELKEVEEEIFCLIIILGCVMNAIKTKLL